MKFNNAVFLSTKLLVTVTWEHDTATALALGWWNFDHVRQFFICKEIVPGTLHWRAWDARRDRRGREGFESGAMVRHIRCPKAIGQLRNKQIHSSELLIESLNVRRATPAKVFVNTPPQRFSLGCLLLAALAAAFNLNDLCKEFPNGMLESEKGETRVHEGRGMSRSY
jgi:hypothetical protein